MLHSIFWVLAERPQREIIFLVRRFVEELEYVPASDHICLHLKFERVGMITLKFKRMQIYLSFGDISVAVAIVFIKLISIKKLVSWYLSISEGMMWL